MALQNEDERKRGEFRGSGTHGQTKGPKWAKVHARAHTLFCATNLAVGAQRMYMQPTRLPRLERVKNTSVASSSLWEYWNSARSVRWSFHFPSAGPVLPEPPTAVPGTPPLDLNPADPAVPGAADPSRSGKREYVGSGGRKASLAAIRLGQGGQQNRQHSSLMDRPFIFSWGWEGKVCVCGVSVLNSLPSHIYDTPMDGASDGEEKIFYLY